MSLSDFATFSTAISGLAVTASLIYLALQTHQNAKHTKALIQQGRVGNLLSMLANRSTESVVAAALEADGQPATPEAIRRGQYALQCVASFAIMRDTHVQSNSGLLDQEQFAIACADYRRLLSQPATLAQWNEMRAMYRVDAPKFTAWIDSLTPQSSG